MKAVYFVVTALVGVVMFWVGLLVRPALAPWEQQETVAGQDAVVEVQQELSAQELAAQGYLPLETLKIRIDDGEVQWYDGTVWHTAATMEEMEKEDKFYVAQENFREFEEQMKQQLEARRAEQESISEQEETLLVGQKVEPKPTEKPRPTNPGGGDSGGSGGSNSGGSNPGGGDSGSSGGSNSGGSNPGGGDSGSSGGNNSGGSNPGGGDSGSSGGNNSGGSNPGGGDSGNSGGNNSGGDTGDGENMEWSDDYL